MIDYKELISSLRNSAKLQAYYAHTAAENTNEYKAADAIEQLAKDNDVLTKERDAAIKDLKYLPLTTCKWVNTDRCKNSCLCERYEWRGVQE